MDKVLKMKEKQEFFEAQVAEIREKDFQAMKERCRVNVTRKGEKMDFLSRLHKEYREAIEEENILRSQENTKLCQKQYEQTKKLADGVLRLKNEEISQQKYRQVLRSDNIELKELESQLKSAYAAKTVQIQLKERQAKRDNEKYFENKNFNMQSFWYNDDTFDQFLKANEIAKKIKYRNDLQDQLIDNENRRRKCDEDRQRERKIVEEISEILYNENLRLAEEKKERILRERNEREAFFKAREIWKLKEIEALLDEYNRDSKIIADKMLCEKLSIDKKIDDTISKDLTIENIAKDILDDEIKRREKEDIFNELIIEEENNEILKNLHDEIVKKENIKKELTDDMKRQELILADKKLKERQVDLAFGKYLNEQYEINLNNDKNKFEERKKIGIKYGNDLKSQIQTRRDIYANEILFRRKVCLNDEEEERKRLDRVSREKSLIFKEHAANLNGFI